MEFFISQEADYIGAIAGLNIHHLPTLIVEYFLFQECSWNELCNFGVEPYRLQESGGIVWADGSAWNYGRGQAPERPEFNYTRDADYCSGASVMVPRALWNDLGGFDEAFSPGYYEDTDLAFRIREAGYRVLYQPFSRVIHFEGVSAGTNPSGGMKRSQTVNREKFLDRWRKVVADHVLPDRARTYYADRRARRHVLVCDASTPTPDQDSGSCDTVALMQALQNLGCHVTFVAASNLLHMGRYTENLQRMGIECLYAPFLLSLEDYLRQEGWRFDLVILCRWLVANQCLDAVKAHAGRARVVFDTVDLHYLRLEREAALRGSKKGLAEAASVRELEVAIMHRVDRTLLRSRYERDLIAGLDPQISTLVMPICREIPGRLAGFDERRDVVFLGGFAHPPNVDAVVFFVKEVWPRVRARLADCRFVVVGSGVGPEVAALADEEGRVVVRGFVPDLAEVFRECRLTVAPLRYGAGVKGKVVTSLTYGVPCVATSVAVEGTLLVDGEHVLVADEPETMAEALVRLDTDRNLWYRLSDGGLAFARENFPPAVLKPWVRALFVSLELLPESG